MHRTRIGRTTQVVAVLAAIVSLPLALKAAESSDSAKDATAKPEAKVTHFSPEQQSSKGAVTVGGRRIDYDAYAGTLVVHLKDWDDVPQNAAPDADKNPPAEASMFYTAYFQSPDKSDKNPQPRPVTFIYNGGPGSSTIWLHMGAFGPKRAVTADDSHTAAAPYVLANNDFSLLDVSDLVFIDAPGTGFSRVAGKDHDKAFFGVDPDAHAFADFIVQFLSKYGRWNSPKYLFGESYGTTRSAVLANVLTTERAVDLNGVILLSQILNFDTSADAPQFNPGIELPYQLILPTYTASAWYHHKLPNAPQDLAALLRDVEHFAMTDYAHALAAGSELSAAERQTMAQRLHDYTGLPVDYIVKADLRINGGEFQKTLLDASDLTASRLDARFAGPTLDPMSKEAEYDPQSAAIASAYFSLFNDYVRKELHFGQDRVYNPLNLDVNNKWNFLHQPPGAPIPLPQSLNVMPDLAAAMKYNPHLHVLLNGGFYDMATPFYEGIYEMQHLGLPPNLQGNIEFAQYESGHMVYAHEASLKELHAKVADFIRRTEAPK